MNVLDAACEWCGRPMRWLVGTPRFHRDCYERFLAESALPYPRASIDSAILPAHAETLVEVHGLAASVGERQTDGLSSS